MFKAGTSLAGKTVEEIFNTDFKPFNMGDLKVGISQVNTMDIDGFMPLKDEMLEYMSSKAEKEGYDKQYDSQFLKALEIMKGKLAN